MKRFLVALLLLASCSFPGQAPSGFVSQTTAVGHYYADGTSGNDTYCDGLVATAYSAGVVHCAKKTLQAVFDLVPFLVKHNTAVHLAGTFTSDSGYLSRAVEKAAYLVVDGGNAHTSVAGPWTADIHSASSIGLTTAGWSVDAYEGYMMEVVDGTCAGQTRTIHGNTATTITPNRNFSADPGTASFRVARPTTEIAGGTLTVRNFGESQIWVQNLYTSGAAVIGSFGSSSGGVSTFTHIVLNSSSTKALQAEQGATGIDYRKRATTASWSLGAAATDSCAGVGSIHVSGGITAHVLASLTSFSVVTKNLFVGNGGVMPNFAFGSRANSFTVGGSRLLAKDGSALITTSANFATTKFGGGAIGIKLYSAAVRIGAGVDVSGCSSHGIEANNSYLWLDGAVTGTGNTGAGVYAHSGSVVHIKDGAAPTLTGTVGDLSFDGTTQASTWAAIDGGTPAALAAEVSMAKQVP